jgi:hypothetical protein
MSKGNCIIASMSLGIARVRRGTVMPLLMKTPSQEVNGDDDDDEDDNGCYFCRATKVAEHVPAATTENELEAKEQRTSNN